MLYWECDGARRGLSYLSFFISWAQISVTATVGSPAKLSVAKVMSQSLGSKVMLLVQADLKSPAPLGKQGGLCWFWLRASTCSKATCTHLTGPGAGEFECLPFQKHEQLMTVFLFPAFKSVGETAWHICKHFEGKPRKTKYLLPVVLKEKKIVIFTNLNVSRFSQEVLYHWRQL